MLKTTTNQNKEFYNKEPIQNKGKFSTCCDFTSCSCCLHEYGFLMDVTEERGKSKTSGEHAAASDKTFMHISSSLSAGVISPSGDIERHTSSRNDQQTKMIMQQCAVLKIRNLQHEQTLSSNYRIF